MAKNDTSSCVGNETKADMEGAMNGKPSSPKAPLSKIGAMRAGEDPLKIASSSGTHGMGQKPMKGVG